MPSNSLNEWLKMIEEQHKQFKKDINNQLKNKEASLNLFDL